MAVGTLTQYEVISRVPLNDDGITTTPGDDPAQRWKRCAHSAAKLAVVTAIVLGLAIYSVRHGRSAELQASSIAHVNLERKSEQEIVWAYFPPEGQRESCGLVEEDVDYVGTNLVAQISEVHSASMCCAACSGYPGCGAWTWGKVRDMPGVGDVCWLKGSGKGLGKDLRKENNTNVTSGLPDPKLVKYGVVPPPVSETHTHDGVVPKDVGVVDEVGPTCPGKLGITGHTAAVLVNSLDSNVEVIDGDAVVSHMHARTYWGETCSESSYSNEMYMALNPLGKTLRYTLDLSGTGCGCNAAFYLSSMRQNTNNGTCGGDYYCDVMSVCGVSCTEIDLQEANMYAWRSTVHAEHDYGGKAAGYGGSRDSPVQRDWTSREYSPGGECIDTTRPFNVAISFPINGTTGDLIAFEVELTQDGKDCPLRTRMTEYEWSWPPPQKNGWPDIQAALKAGMTPVMSYWKSDTMLWMDGLGEDGRGPCVRDDPDKCPESVRWYNFSIETYVDAVEKPLTTVTAASSSTVATTAASFSKMATTSTITTTAAITMISQLTSVNTSSLASRWTLVCLPIASICLLCVIIFVFVRGRPVGSDPRILPREERILSREVV